MEQGVSTSHNRPAEREHVPELVPHRYYTCMGVLIVDELEQHLEGSEGTSEGGCRTRILYSLAEVLSTFWGGECLPKGSGASVRVIGQGNGVVKRWVGIQIRKEADSEVTTRY